HVRLLAHHRAARAGRRRRRGRFPPMTGRTGHLAAVDLGATSGRVMLASVGPSSLDIRPLTRFANEPVYLWNGERSAMHWDVPGLFRHACKGLAEALRQAPDLVSIGVDSWAVDYGLLRR